MATERELSIVLSAQDNASSKIASLGEKMGGIFAKIGVGVGAAGVAIGAMAAKGVADFADIGGAVQDMADKTGLSTRAISGLRVAAQLSGTSIDTVEAAVKKMTLTNLTAATASDELKSAMLDCDNTIEDFTKASPEDQFKILADAIDNARDPAQKARLAFEAFGKAGTDLLPMFADGSFSLEAYNKQAEKLGVSFSPEKAAQAAALGDAMDKVKMMMQGLSLTVGGALAPILTSLMENVIVPLAPVVQNLAHEAFDVLKASAEFLWQKIQGLMETLKQSGVIDAFKVAFQLLADAWNQSLWPAIIAVWTAIQPLVPLFETLGKFIGVVVIGAVLLLVAGLAAFIAIVGQVVKRLSEWIDLLIKFFKPAIDSVQSDLNALIGVVKSIVQWFSNAYDMISKVIAKLGEFAAASSGGAVGGLLGGVIGAVTGHRALGGPINAGQTYLVGENGPEMFVSSSAGSIVPNGRFGGGSSMVLNNNVTIGSIANDMDVQRVTQVIGENILSMLRQQLPI